MAKKRKSEATRMEEVDRGMYTTFCGAANSLSQLYSQAINHQRLSFQAGERHALEKLYQWILQQQEEGSRVTNIDIVSYLQNELDYNAEESPVSPRLPHQHQHAQSAAQFSNPNHVAAIPVGSATAGQGFRVDQQSKNSVFSNALSSPVRRSLQHYHLGQGSINPNSVMPSGNGARQSDAHFHFHQNRDPTPPSFTDSSSMDMHPDSPY